MAREGGAPMVPSPAFLADSGWLVTCTRPGRVCRITADFPAVGRLHAGFCSHVRCG